MNKKGVSTVDGIMFILSFVTISLSIYIGVVVYYGGLTDIRINEARILSDKLMKSLIEEDNLEKILVDDKTKNFDILKEANLNGNILSENYYFKVEILENDKTRNFIYGNRDFDVECRLSEVIFSFKEEGLVCDLKSNSFPGCCFRKEKININGKEINVNILTASRQLSSRI